MSTIDMVDHTGLRGVAAMWVMIFHVFRSSKLAYDFQGSTLMPLFFLLSGFSLTITYNDEKKLKSLNCKLKYFYNRLLRVLPVYYIAILEAIPVARAGFSSFNPKDKLTIIKSVIIALIPISTWPTFILIGPQINPSGWTISTLTFFWVCFPWILPYMKKLSDQELLKLIMNCFWFQFLWIIISFPIVLIFVTGKAGFGPIRAFLATTTWPLTRLPVFMMGMAGGILCVRYPGKDMPWFSFSGSLIPWKSISFQASVAPDMKVNYNDSCNSQAMKLLLLTLTLCALSILNVNLTGNYWLQALNAFALLDLLVSLVKGRGSTKSSQFLRSTMCQWLGDRSMSIYLIHSSLIQVICWWRYGWKTIEWPASLTCSDHSENSSEHMQCIQDNEAWADHRLMPWWGIIVVPFVSIVFAHILYEMVEEPIRKFSKRI